MKQRSLKNKAIWALAGVFALALLAATTLRDPSIRVFFPTSPTASSGAPQEVQAFAEALCGMDPVVATRYSSPELLARIGSWFTIMSTTPDVCQSIRYLGSLSRGSGVSEYIFVVQSGNPVTPEFWWGVVMKDGLVQGLE